MKNINNNYQKQKSLPKFKFFRYLLPLIFIGLAAVILLNKISTLENTVSVLRSMPVWLVGMAIIAQVCSYLSSGYLLKVIVNSGRFLLSVGRGTLIYMAAASIGLAGGWISSAATTYYWVSKDDDISGEAVLAGVLPSLYNSVVLISVTIIGMVYLLFNHDLSRTQIDVYCFILVITVVGILIIFYGLQHREKVERLILGIAKKLIRFLKRNYDLSVIHNKIDQFYNGMKQLSNRGWIKLGFGPTMNIVFDMLTLYLFFIAAGYFVKPSVLIAGYSLAFLLGRGAFFIPGGAGVIEGGMVAIYTSLGVPSDINVVVVLGYRFVSFWLPSLLGFGAMFYLQRTSGHDKCC